MKDKRDINIKIAGVTLNCRAVGVIINNNKILFQKRKNDKFWALPGGKINVLEKSADTVIRELKEEIGLKSVVVDRLLSVSEYFFKFGKEKYHQYIFAYKINIDRNELILSMDEFDGLENGKEIIYKWFDISSIEEAPIKPDFLKTRLANIKENIEFIFYEEKN